MVIVGLSSSIYSDAITSFCESGVYAMAKVDAPVFNALEDPDSMSKRVIVFL